jgi:ZIP family zinc transporter
LWIPGIIAGLSTPLGATVIMGLRHVSGRVLAFVLALASGVMITVAVTELIPRGIRLGGLAPAVVGLAAGGIGMVFLRAGILRLAGKATPFGNERLGITGALIAVALAIHDIPEGLAITAGDIVSPHVGLLIAAAIALHNIPEGMSIAAPMLAAGAGRGRVALITAAVGCVTPLATWVAAGLRDVPAVWVAAVLAFAGGVMLTVVLQDALPTAAREDPRVIAVGLAAGGLLMAVLSARGIAGA